MKNDAKLSDHASQRLIERTSVSPLKLCELLNNDEVINIGVYDTRISKLFFSSADNKFFIAIQDQISGSVITILPIEYWKNLSKKYFNVNREVSKSKLLDAIRASDPLNDILTHPPILNAQKINFSIKVKNYRSVNGGSIDIDLLFKQSEKYLSGILASQFITKLKVKGFNEDDICSIGWGVKRERNYYAMEDGPNNYSQLIRLIKDEICVRNNLLNKYDDFLDLINNTNDA